MACSDHDVGRALSSPRVVRVQGLHTPPAEPSGQAFNRDVPRGTSHPREHPADSATARCTDDASWQQNGPGRSDRTVPPRRFTEPLHRAAPDGHHQARVRLSGRTRGTTLRRCPGHAAGSAYRQPIAGTAGTSARAHPGTPVITDLTGHQSLKHGRTRPLHHETEHPTWRSWRQSPPRPPTPGNASHGSVGPLPRSHRRWECLLAVVGSGVLDVVRQELSTATSWTVRDLAVGAHITGHRTTGSSVDPRYPARRSIDPTGLTGGGGGAPTRRDDHFLYGPWGGLSPWNRRNGPGGRPRLRSWFPPPTHQNGPMSTSRCPRPVDRTTGRRRDVVLRCSVWFRGAVGRTGRRAVDTGRHRIQRDGRRGGGVRTRSDRRADLRMARRPAGR